MNAGRFITLEGGEGVGKSTLARALGEVLRAQGKDVVLTREPGGAPGADTIRSLLVSGENGRWNALEEALLFTAARANHLRITILPALTRGAWVICDRYTDSTRAYQAAAGDVSSETLNALQAIIAAPTPDLTLMLDIDPMIGLARSKSASLGEDRFEKRGASFHARVRQAFLDIAKAEPARCALIDAGQSPEAVREAALAILRERL